MRQMRVNKPMRMVLAALAAAGMFTLNTAHAQSAVTLNGGWAPFNRCPVNSAAMLAADGVNVTDYCIASNSTSGILSLGTMGVIHLGPVSIGNAPVTAGKSDAQFGAAVANGTFDGITGISPSGGAVLADPALVPGGLLGLMCPSTNPVISQVCNGLTNNSLNEVVATLESAGTPTNFNLFAALQTGVTVVTLPVKVHLTNALLGSGCYIGSNSHPILLNPQNTAIGGAGSEFYDFNGNVDPNGALEVIAVTGATQSDTTFAVPAASGCTLLNIPFSQIILDAVLNLKVGLPSPAGRNYVTLNNVTESVMSPTTSNPAVTGADFAAAWQSAIVH
jgi:hypothetical protein